MSRVLFTHPNTDPRYVPMADPFNTVPASKESLYPRVMHEGELVFVGHPKAACVDCEFPLGNERRHPKVGNGLIRLCGRGQKMKLVS